MLQLLHERRVKRLILLSDGRTAIVEVPVENTESDFDTVTYNRRDLRWAAPAAGPGQHVAPAATAARRSGLAHGSWGACRAPWRGVPWGRNHGAREGG